MYNWKQLLVSTLLGVIVGLVGGVFAQLGVNYLIEKQASEDAQSFVREELKAATDSLLVLDEIIANAITELQRHKRPILRTSFPPEIGYQVFFPIAAKYYSTDQRICLEKIYSLMFAIKMFINSFPRSVYEQIDSDIASIKYNMQNGIGNLKKFDEVSYRSKALITALLTKRNQMKTLLAMINGFLVGDPAKCRRESVKIRKAAWKFREIPRPKKAAKPFAK